MSSYDFVHWGGKSRLDNIEQDINNLKGSRATGHAVFSLAGAVTVGAGTTRFPIPYASTISGVMATAGTPPTGAALVFDVNVNGTTAFTTQANRPTIADGAQQTDALAVPDVTSLATNDYISVDIDQIGSTVAGSDVVVAVFFS